MLTNKKQEQERQEGQGEQWQPNLAKPKEPLLRGSVGTLDTASGVNRQNQHVPRPAFNGLTATTTTTNKKPNYWLLSKANWEKAGIAIGGIAAAAAAYLSIRVLRSMLRTPEETTTGLPDRREHIPQATEAQGSYRPYGQPSARVYPGGPRPSAGGGVQLPDFGIPMATEVVMPQGVSVQATGAGQRGSAQQFRPA